MDGATAVPGWRLSRNQEVVTLHVRDARDWADGVSARSLRGDTLLLDYSFFLHPTAIGHWGEMLFPLYRCVWLFLHPIPHEK